MEPQDSTIWPPPPLGAASLAAWFPFRFLDLRVQGEVSDFRHGWIGIESSGVTIRGKIAARSYGQILIVVLYAAHHWLPFRIWLLLLATWIIYTVSLYVFRKSMTLTVRWCDVQQIVFDKDKRRTAIVYGAPDKSGKNKTSSLVFALNAALYHSFVTAAEQYAPGLGFANKLRRESLVAAYAIVLHMLVILLLAMFLSRLVMGHH